MKSLLRIIRRGGSGEEVNVGGDRYGNLHVSHGLPPYAEITAMGEGWQVMATSAVPCLNARPGAAAALTLWNGEEGDGKSYVIDRVFAQQLVSTGAECRWGIWVCVHPERTATSSSSLAFRGLSGKYNYSGKGIAEINDTVVDSGWFPWGDGKDVEVTGVLGGSQMSVNVDGRIIIPPHCAISLHGVDSAGNTDLCHGLAWYEVQLDLK